MRKESDLGGFRASTSISLPLSVSISAVSASIHASSSGMAFSIPVSNVSTSTGGEGDGSQEGDEEHSEEVGEWGELQGGEFEEVDEEQAQLLSSSSGTVGSGPLTSLPTTKRPLNRGLLEACLFLDEYLIFLSQFRLLRFSRYR
jgi:hypothetical protein